MNLIASTINNAIIIRIKFIIAPTMNKFFADDLVIYIYMYISIISLLGFFTIITTKKNRI